MTLACWVTSTRFVFAPLILWLLTRGTLECLIWAAVTLLVSGFSDMVDGWVARSRGEVSELGKLLDPLADKTVMFLMLLGLSLSWGLPSWLVVVYAVKELLQVLAGALLIKNFKELIPANYWGKGSTCGFFLGFLLFMFVKPVSIGITVIVISFAFSVYALYTYYLAYRQLKVKKSVSEK